jgi:hypothetical protein
VEFFPRVNFFSFFLRRCATPTSELAMFGAGTFCARQTKKHSQISAEKALPHTFFLRADFQSAP